VSGGCAGSSVIRSCCGTGPLTLVDGEGAGNGEGIRPSKILRSGGGLGTATVGFGELETCALATVTGATARIRTTRTLVSGRMTSGSIAVPRH
jgi:hypothetical protein